MNEFVLLLRQAFIGGNGEPRKKETRLTRTRKGNRNKFI